METRSQSCGGAGGGEKKDDDEKRDDDEKKDGDESKQDTEKRLIPAYYRRPTPATRRQMELEAWVRSDRMMNSHRHTQHCLWGCNRPATRLLYLRRGVEPDPITNYRTLSEDEITAPNLRLIAAHPKQEAMRIPRKGVPGTYLIQNLQGPKHDPLPYFSCFVCKKSGIRIDRVTEHDVSFRHGFNLVVKYAGRTQYDNSEPRKPELDINIPRKTDR
jgi:hypothetical protein